MKKRLLWMAIPLGGAITLFLLFRSPEPKYQGVKITAWQDQWASQKSGVWPSAVKNIGTNALPYAIRNLALNDSAWRSNYSRMQSRLPTRLQAIFRKPKLLLREVDGANVFFYIGSNSVPFAIALLKSESPTVRRSAAWGLGGLRRQSAVANEAIPALIEALEDKDQSVCFDAALSLEEFGPAASNAVPALARIVIAGGSITNSSYYLRAVAAVALGKIGPAAKSALPALTAALQQPNSYFRGQCAVAIWRIDSDVDTTLPVILKEMPGNVQDSKWDWIIAIGEMGPRAKAAIPQLKTELKQDNYKWVLEYVTNALDRIGPEAASNAVETRAAQ